jgi:OOP family OmpA-OmpF porin
VLGRGQSLQDFRGQRRESQQGGRTIIQEPGRTIIREGDRTVIQHNETDRFRFGARDVRTERRNGENVTVVVRPDGSRIVTTTDDNGRLLRRARRDQSGRDVIIIDNSRRGPPGRPGPGGVAVGAAIGLGLGAVLNLPPPQITIPRERYIVDTDGADREVIYETLIAPPVERIERRYTLDEIRYSAPLRDRMRRVDIDTINFETGSWEVGAGQTDRLAFVAQAINQAIQRNPNEVFLIEGHTDAVGADIDNLSLSDRRAESVALVLTEQFQVPPENLTTQGYGEQYLKVNTQDAERQNRRVTVRRITPLLTGANAAQ